MNTIAEVRLWGSTIGAVSIEDDQRVASFEYDPQFARSGVEPSPIMMPVKRSIYRFPELSQRSFHGLPGMLSDSLPDKFGNALINAWLASQGRTPDSFNAVERLCYTGRRGMGALEYRPAIGPVARQTNKIQVDRLVQLASEILSQRNNLKVSFEEKKKEEALKQILRVGTSAGGARAKAVIAWNPQTNEVRSGQIPAEKGFEYWLLKFDGVSGNKDKELEDPKEYGVAEYAYYLMAKSAGIDITECRLFEEADRRHFMTKRFDRLNGGEKLHMQSLAAMAHFDFNMAGAYSYEQAILTARQLDLPMESIEQLYRRMCFNIIARNQDDHVKNIAFLMDKKGKWSLSPAFDLTYAYNPEGDWTSRHQMTLNGKQDNFSEEDFQECARISLMKRGRWKTIYQEVYNSVKRWPDFAEEASLNSSMRDAIHKGLRL